MHVINNDMICSSFPNWWQKFKEHSINSEVIKIPDDVLSYLGDSGTIVLPPSTHTPQDFDSSDDEDWTSDTPITNIPNIEDFSKKIKEIIERLGGCVMPKLNWSSPSDAASMSFNNTLQCHTANDVYILLKSSDRVQQDLEDCQKLGANLSTHLVLKQWIDVHPGEEFRAFIQDGKMLGICQRDTTQQFEYIAQERSAIVADVFRFWQRKVAKHLNMSNYVMDVIRRKDKTGRSAGHLCVLVDFSPLEEERTDSLLFEWGELREGISDPIVVEGPETVDILCGMDSMDMSAPDELVSLNDMPELRYINKHTGVQPLKKRGKIGNFPTDIIKFFEEEMRKQTQEDSDMEE